jgi:hypothetical protein
MRNMFLLLVVVSMSFVGCSDDNPIVSPDKSYVTLTLPVANNWQTIDTLSSYMFVNYDDQHGIDFTGMKSITVEIPAGLDSVSLLYWMYVRSDSYCYPLLTQGTLTQGVAVVEEIPAGRLAPTFRVAFNGKVPVNQTVQLFEAECTTQWP